MCFVAEGANKPAAPASRPFGGLDQQLLDVAWSVAHSIAGANKPACRRPAPSGGLIFFLTVEAHRAGGGVYRPMWIDSVP